MVTGNIHSFETLGALDGPGLRFVVFFSGCPLRCLYCHNPDTWAREPGIKLTPDQLMAKVTRYAPYFGKTGGITLSGGEPLLQPEFALEVMKRCRQAGISTCVDTSGSVFNDSVKAALAFTDLVLLDVKHTAPDQYKKLTGGDLTVHRAFLDYCKEKNLPLWIRQVIVPDWNASVSHIQALGEYVRGANVKKIELLPYHTLGVHKWKALGLSYGLEGVAPPSAELMRTLQEEALAACPAAGASG